MVKADLSYIYSQLVTINLCDEMFIVMLYPNPAKNKLLITTDGQNEKVIFKIFDNTGMKAKEITTILNGTTSIDIIALPIGIYNLEITTKNNTKIIKFIKE